MSRTVTSRQQQILDRLGDGFCDWEDGLSQDGTWTFCASRGNDLAPTTPMFGARAEVSLYITADLKLTVREEIHFARGARSFYRPWHYGTDIDGAVAAFAHAVAHLDGLGRPVRFAPWHHLTAAAVRGIVQRRLQSELRAQREQEAREAISRSIDADVIRLAADRGFDLAS